MSNFRTTASNQLPLQPGALNVSDGKDVMAEPEITPQQRMAADRRKSNMLMLLAIVPAALTLLGLLGEVWWGFDALNLFSFQYTGVLVILMLLCLGTRFWKPALFCIPLILLNLWLLSPLFLSADSGAGEPGTLWATGRPAAIFDGASSFARESWSQVTESSTSQGEKTVSKADSNAPVAATISWPFGTQEKAASQKQGDRYDAISGDPSADRFGTLKVMLYHLPPWPIDKEPTYDFIRRSDADIILLQGVSNQWREELYWQVAPFRIAHIATRAGTEGLAVLHRVRLGATHRLKVDSSSRYLLNDKRWPVVVSNVDYYGASVTILNASLPLPIAAGKAQDHQRMMNAIADWSSQQDQPVMVMGNLGTTSWSKSMQGLRASAGLHDSHTGYGFQGSWPAGGGFTLGQIPINHLLYSGELKVLDRQLLPPINSEHRPLVVTLKLPESETSESSAVPGLR